MKVISNIIASHLLVVASLAVAMTGWTSCSDELDVGGNGPEIEGRDTRISLSVTAPKMSDRVSRADMADADAFNVRTLWVGIYNATTGESTLTDASGHNGLFVEKEGEYGFKPSVDQHVTHSLTGIDTKSGRSYIVAVANPDVNTGYKMDDSGKLGTETSLKDLLQAAATWDDFLAIVISRDLDQGAANVFIPNATENPLPMSGIYTADNSHSDNVDWGAVEPVYIAPNTAQLDGAIHLRRPYSQIKFNIRVADGTDIVSIDPQLYIVHNVPTYGWLYERKQADIAEKPWQYANAGDPMEPDAEKNQNYKNSLTYTSTSISETDGVYSFDFWQMENKRTGILADGAGYQLRDKEHKNDDKTNTGVYSSLCPTPEQTLNNKASYVEIRCKLVYDPAHQNNPDQPVNPKPEDIGEDIPEFASREVDATYIVHLGYINEAVNDFNSLRNSIYTYNVQIKSATEIIVEAYTDTENQPGAAGTVIDVTDKLFNIDAHYAAFNIQLTDEDLSSFSFTMQSCSDIRQYTFAVDQYGNEVDGSDAVPAENSPDYPYFSWVELAKTTDENTLAKYPGIGSKELYKLNQIRNNPDLTAGWYTVFVNEYTYEDETEGGRGHEGTEWWHYVNQPNRTAYLNVAQQTSADGQSRYYRSKYAVSQRSIQTYYSIADDSGTALGVEHENETFGMNLRWITGNATNIDGGYYPTVDYRLESDGGTLTDDNGRYNVWISSGGADGSAVAGEWATYVQMTKPNSVKKITNVNQKLPSALTAPKIWPVPMPMQLASSNFTDPCIFNKDNGDAFPKVYEKQAGDYDPQINHDEAQYIHAMHACMNRNRDLNGDGKIDANEMRWYLPASGKYVRVILGRNSLATPIMDYEGNPELPFSCSRGENARFHMISSDGVVLWCEEGLSRSKLHVENYSGPPWAVRCIRNLGTNLNDVTKQEKVSPAYEPEMGTGAYATGGIVKVKHYYGTALRDYSASPLPMHKVNSQYNKLGRYGFEVALRGNVVEPSSYGDWEAVLKPAMNLYSDYTNAIMNASPCSDLNEKSGRKGWRLPNQKEIVIIRRLNVLDQNYYPYNFYMSCTQEYWNPKDNKASTYNEENRILTVRSTGAAAERFSNITLARCVRDLTAAEAGMTYDQVRNYKQP